MKIHKIIFNVLIISLLAPNAQAQLQQYKKGLARFEKGDYDLAIKELVKVKDIAETEKANLNFKIAEAYRLTNRWVEAAPFYQNALDAKISDPNVNFHYAYALKAEGKYNEALSQLEQFVAAKSTNKVYNEKAYREVNTLKIMSEIQKKKQDIEFKSLSQLNTKGAEFSPVVRGDEMIFTASRKDKIYANGLPFVGLYKAKIGAKGLTDLGKAEVFAQNVYDTERNEGTPTFSPDGKTMIFSRGNSGKRKDISPDMDLYMSRYVDGSGWSEPYYVSASDSASWDGSPSFSRDGKSLYFASNRAGGLGGQDLYRVNMDASGRFGTPTNLGKEINTAGDEMFPYVSEDGKLYFASDGHPGLGKLDIFVAIRASGKITIENMGIPYNSYMDDFGLTIDKNGDIFFSSNRAGGAGDDDIYYYEVPPKTTIAENTQPLAPEPPKISETDKNLTIKTVNYYLAGTILAKNDNKTSALDSAKVRILDGENEQLITEVYTTKDGYFGPIKLKEDGSYIILADKKTYLAKREDFSMNGRAIPQFLLKKAVTDTTFLTSLNLERIVVDKAIRLDNIYYDLDKWAIRPDAAIELDKLVQILKDNPSIKIELSSHTDARATDAHNNLLSQRRAESAVNYIISKGIDGSRMVAKGYGETQLIVQKARTEDEHQVNRRTEFKVTEIQ
jgi:peptidoglycan-associated lipoprotein